MVAALMAPLVGEAWAVQVELRLRRFQQVIAYRSLNLAARAISVHPSTLATQIGQLETAIGKPLLTRGRPRRPMTLTQQGHALLAMLEHPRVAQLLDEYAKSMPG
ncbi:LysR family transcriptional regulator [Dactylosporangium sp. NPDC000244]|uniref:LysR family transcriptional regulator n=1 Tax=Dactylosporangium sp. NPDC000244 TaxID=3154365 RepID=UPI003332FA14